MNDTNITSNGTVDLRPLQVIREDCHWAGKLITVHMIAVS